MRINYYDLYEHQFENLVIAICQKILGIGVQGFSKGPDGGRDAIFKGTANCFPSKNSPIRGKIIIQAKHTDDVAGKFSDSHFSGEIKSSTLSKEIPKIKRLRQKGEIDHYILFSNRRLGGEADSNIKKRISDATGVESVYLIGSEGLDGYIKLYPEVIRIADIHPFETPLRINPDDIAEIIIAISKYSDIFKQAFEKDDPIMRVKFESKNIINHLSEEYVQIIKRDYMMNFYPVKKFLEHFENRKYLDLYRNSAEDFNLQVIEHKRDYHTFDQVLNHLYDILINRDSDLRKNKKLTRLMLFYMYWNCDIGKEHIEDDKDEKRCLSQQNSHTQIKLL